MGYSKLSYWIVLLIGAMAIIASIYAYLKGGSFLTYFLGGFAGILLILTALISKRKREDREEK